MNGDGERCRKVEEEREWDGEGDGRENAREWRGKKILQGRARKGNAGREERVHKGEGGAEDKEAMGRREKKADVERCTEKIEDNSR
jgi:hypothetical protein